MFSYLEFKTFSVSLSFSRQLKIIDIENHSKKSCLYDSNITYNLIQIKIICTYSAMNYTG